MTWVRVTRRALLAGAASVLLAAAVGSASPGRACGQPVRRRRRAAAQPARRLDRHDSRRSPRQLRLPRRADSLPRRARRPGPAICAGLDGHAADAACARLAPDRHVPRASTACGTTAASIWQRSSVTLAESLAGHGYRTGAFVGSFVLDSRWGLDQGFEHYFDDFDLSGSATAALDEIQRPGEEVVGRAIEWLGRDASRPFFAWVHLYDPHTPYAAPAPFQSQFPPTLDSAYDAEIAYTDHQVGRLFDHLAAGGEFEPDGDRGPRRSRRIARRASGGDARVLPLRRHAADPAAHRRAGGAARARSAIRCASSTSCRRCSICWASRSTGRSRRQPDACGREARAWICWRSRRPGFRATTTAGAS